MFSKKGIAFFILLLRYMHSNNSSIFASKNNYPMKIQYLLLIFLTIFILNKKSFAQQTNQAHYPQEKHLENVKQLTFGGDNAEAYFSFDSQKITFQSNNKAWGVDCDQIFYFDLKKGDMSQTRPPMVSTSKGRTTCSYFLPGDKKIVYASTH